MKIRPFKKPDAGAVAQLFHDTIRRINSRDYSPHQIKAWAPDDIHFRDWAARCSARYTLVAELNGMVVGFAELEPDGHIGCFYCHMDFQGEGIGRLLFSALEAEAKRKNNPRLYAEVSITGRPFFRKMGLLQLEKKTMHLRGADLQYYQMEKPLRYPEEWE